GSHVRRRSSIGGAGQPAACPEPRIAMSWVVGAPEYEPSALASNPLPAAAPALRARLGLATGQIIAYSGQTSPRKSLRTLCFRAFKRQAAFMSAYYRDKVEFIHFCRPAPPAEVHLKASSAQQLKQPVD